MRLSTALSLGLALFALLAVPPGRAHGQDVEQPDDEGFRFYDTAAKKILKSAGNKVWDAAEQAKRSGFFQFANEQAQRAIKFDPNQKDAREYLGYVKKGKTWVLDEELAAKVVKQNRRGGGRDKAQESQESFDKRIETWKEEHLKKANKFVAARYAKLADECAKKGFPLQAKKGYESALRVDKENTKARKGLGFKKFGKVWLTSQQQKAKDDAGKAEEVKEESRWDGILGETLTKAQTLHWRVEGAGLPAAEMIDIAAACEMAYAYYLSDLGRDPTVDVLRRERAVHVFMKDGDQWTKWCDAFGGDDFTRKMGGTGSRSSPSAWGTRMTDSSNPTTRKDGALHNLGHVMNHHVLGLQGGAWIDEGLCYYYSVKVQETCLTHCVALKKAQYGGQKAEGGLKDWKDPANWKPNVREMVSAQSDVELRKLVTVPITKLEFAATVKSWSVISWMMDEYRDTFIDLVNGLRGVGNHTSHIESDFERSLEELDKEWREYVLRNY